MDEAIGGLIGILIVAGIAIWIAVVVLTYVLAACFVAIAGLATLIMASLDGITSSALLPSAPAVLWGLWGALIGGALAFWLVAPIYGLRKQRPLIVAGPLVAMGVVAILANAL